MSTYGYTQQINAPFEQALEWVKEAFAAQGFGVLSEIDVQKTLHEKTGAEIQPYVIVGVCNPTYAHKALRVEREIGLLLPCNVIVYEENGAVQASAVDPVKLMQATGNDELTAIASGVQDKLETSINNAADL